MNQRLIAIFVLAAAVYCLTPGHASAQCGSGFVELKLLISTSPEVSAVFSGTVADIQTLDSVLVVTFDVDGIWKGDDVGKRALIYRPIFYRKQKPGTRGGGGPRRPFEIGKRYVVVAHTLTHEERADFGVQSAKLGSLAVDVCASGSRPYEIFARSDLKEMGPGRKPR